MTDPTQKLVEKNAIWCYRIHLNLQEDKNPHSELSKLSLSPARTNEPSVTFEMDEPLKMTSEETKELEALVADSKRKGSGLLRPLLFIVDILKRTSSTSLPSEEVEPLIEEPGTDSSKSPPEEATEATEKQYP